MENTSNFDDTSIELEEAIQRAALILGYTPDDLSDGQQYEQFFRLGNILKGAWFKDKLMPALGESILLYENAAKICPSSAADRDDILFWLADVLFERYEILREMDDIQKSINILRETLSLRPKGHQNRAATLNNLGAALSHRYGPLGQAADLDECLRLHEEALSLRPVGHPDRHSSLNNLGAALSDRYGLLGQVADLEECIRLYEEALSLCPVGHPDRHSSLDDLGAAFNDRYGLLGQAADLEECIRLYEEALSLRPVGHPDRHWSLNNLGSALSHRYALLGQVAGLDECIRLHEEALSLRPVGHPDRHWSLNNLGGALSHRYGLLGQVADLDECIRLHEEALSLRPVGHPDRHWSLNNLGGALSHRYALLGQVADLEECIRLYEDALSLCPVGHPDRHWSLNNLGGALSHRYRLLGQVADLDECIRLYEEALSLRPVGHPHRYRSLNHIAMGLVDRYTRLDNSNDLEAAFSHLRSGAEDTLSSQVGSLESAFLWIRLAKEHHHDSLKEAYVMALECLRRYLSIGSTIKLQYEALLRQDGVTALPVDAAAYFIQQGCLEQAVELLDEGRGLLVSEMRRLRETLSAGDEEKIGKHLSSQYLTLCKELRSLSNVAVRFETYSASATSHSETRSEATTMAYGRLLKEKREKLREYDNLLAEIRDIPGCADFQRIPKFKGLQTAASEGPIVIINCSEARSDVVIVFADRKPQLVPLVDSFRSRILEVHQLYLESLQSMAEDYRSSFNSVRVVSASIQQVAEDLWDLVISTVDEKLEEAGVRKGSRIWLCPTSFLTALPLHAAGKDGDFLLNHFVPSYTSTLSALIDARRPMTMIRQPSSPRIFVAAQTKTSGLSHAEDEVKRMSKLGSFVHCFDEEEATPASVIEHLPSYDWAHFICHGTVSKDPFESALILHNKSKLTLSEIIKAHLPDARFAFLAACHTAELSHGEVLKDEVLHLSTAMQSSGFRGVIGTMWQMADEDGPRLAEVFYGQMLYGEEAGERHTRAAHALWRAVQMMRRKKLPMSRWANFIHIGA